MEIPVLHYSRNKLDFFTPTLLIRRRRRDNFLKKCGFPFLVQQGWMDIFISRLITHAVTETNFTLWSFMLLKSSFSQKHISWLQFKSTPILKKLIGRQLVSTHFSNLHGLQETQNPAFSYTYLFPAITHKCTILRIIFYFPKRICPQCEFRVTETRLTDMSQVRRARQMVLRLL